jgi:[ribosomal protein S5]-alanine N-acetyltransferase
VDMAEGWLQFSEAMIWMRDFLLEHPDQLGWWNYLIIHRNDRRVIGTCGFKGPPAIDDSVEIGYEVAPAYQHRGLATEAARALCDFAFAHPDIQNVTAHTLAEENASVALLRRLGFDFKGELVDIEDGLIWSWSLERGKA